MLQNESFTISRQNEEVRSIFEWLKEKHISKSDYICKAVIEKHNRQIAGEDTTETVTSSKIEGITTAEIKKLIREVMRESSNETIAATKQTEPKSKVEKLVQKEEVKEEKVAVPKKEEPKKESYIPKALPEEQEINESYEENENVDLLKAMLSDMDEN